MTRRAALLDDLSPDFAGSLTNSPGRVSLGSVSRRAAAQAVRICVASPIAPTM